MKKIALTAVIVASLSAGAAMAEPFNNRGLDYAATVQPNTSVQRESVTAQANRFNNGGIHYMETISNSGNMSRSEVNPVVRGFNDRQNFSKANSEVRIGYAR